VLAKITTTTAFHSVLMRAKASVKNLRILFFIDSGKSSLMGKFEARNILAQKYSALGLL